MGIGVICLNNPASSMMIRYFLPLAFAGLSQALSAATLFQESFNVDHVGGDPIPSSNSSIGLVNWNGYYGTPDSIADDSPSSGSSYRIGVLTGSSAPSGQGDGYLFFQHSASATVGTDHFAYTSTSLNSGFPAIIPSAHTAVSMNWVQSLGSFASGGYYVALEINGTWHVSTTNQRALTGSTRSFDLYSATWRTLDLVTGTGGHLALDSDSSTSAELFLGGNPITGIGFYVENLPVPGSTGTSTLRIDSLEIESVPEPTASALALAGAAILLRRSRNE